MTSFRKVQRLSTDERWLLAQALVLLPLTFCGVYALGVSRWQRLLISLVTFRKTSGLDFQLAEKRSTEGPVFRDEEETWQRADAIARIVRVAAYRGVYQASCLQQTLVLWCLLRRNRIESEIRYGARKEEGRLQAHAWIEVGGVALGEETDVCLYFSPFERVAASTQCEAG